MSRAVYLDHNATTPLDPRALEVMMPYLTSEFGNASSSTHAWGLRARTAVETARREVAALLGAEPEEIVFTSGATEANNLALRGAARQRARAGRGRHLVTTAIEHDSVLATVEDLERDGFTFTVIVPDPEGRVAPDRVERTLRDDTLLVSVGSANGEIGTVQPVAEIAALCHDRGILFHTDATQAIGKVPLRVDASPIDLLSLSSHKMYGPKGVGALYVRRGTLLEPLLTGGGQERGLRSGTLNVPGIVGMGAAARLRAAEMEVEARTLGALRDALWQGVLRIVPDARLNGHPEHRIPGTLNVVIPRIDSDRLLAALGSFGLSAGSACHSGSGHPSPVLAALGLSPELAGCSVRFGLGKSTARDEVDALLVALEKAVRRMRGAPSEPSASHDAVSLKGSGS
jgi:cysteine desulfurase